MARRSTVAAPMRDAGLRDWLLLGAIVLVGGSSFSMIRAAVETAPPPLVAVGRLWVGALFLTVAALAKGRRFPSLLVRTNVGLRVHRAWAYMMAIGATGSTLPFFIFPWAQQYIDSSLAGVYMAFMPIWTLGLAYLFAGETMTANKAIGFALGFAGVIILMGPEAISGAAGSSLAPQLGLLVATFLYAIAAVLARRAPTIRPRVFAAGSLLAAAVFATPGLLFADLTPGDWSLRSLLAIVGLGLFPTGLGAVLIIVLIKRMGASFMALANYVTPLWAMALGAVLFGEQLHASEFLALGVILVGVFVSQQRRAAPIVETGDAFAAEIAPVMDAGGPRARQNADQ